MISRDSPLYKALRWAYQPIKYSKQRVQEWSSLPSRNQTLANYLRRRGFKGLHIGCGSLRYSGWMNTDLVGTPGIDFALDVEKPLPIANGVLDAIYGSEVIEHIQRETAKRFLHQAYRVLKPGGVLRLTTPDLKAVCEIYMGINDQTSLEDQKSTWLEHEFSPDYWINTFFRGWGHQWIWDFESLTELIRSSGFDRVERVQPQVTKSGMSELENLGTRYGVPAPKHCWATSMILEATR